MLDEKILLLLETATEICSVALSSNDTVIHRKDINEGFSHAQNLIPLIDEVLRESGLDKRQLSAVALGIGPGSYTGLRIGASTAKGISYALDIPVIAVGTLQCVMMGAKKEVLPTLGEEVSRPLFCPMIDARRMEVFAAPYSPEGILLDKVSAVVVDEHSFEELLRDQLVVFCGNGMPKCREILSRHPNARFSSAPLSAANLAEPAWEKYRDRDFEDRAYFEPFYLKEYVAVKSGVKGLE